MTHELCIAHAKEALQAIDAIGASYIAPDFCDPATVSSARQWISDNGGGVAVWATIAQSLRDYLQTHAEDSPEHSRSPS